MVTLMILSLLVGQTMTWAKAYDRYYVSGDTIYSCNDTAYAIACDTSTVDLTGNAYVVVGHTDKGPFGGLDILVTKLSALDGSVIWSRAYGYPGLPYVFNEYGRSVIVDYADTAVYYVIAGYIEPGVWGDIADAIVFKVRASDGSLVWGWAYSFAWWLDPDWIWTADYAYSIIEDGSDYLVAGNVENYIPPFVPCGGISDALVFKVVDQTGFFLWAMSYGKWYPEGKDEYLYSIIEDSTSIPCSLFVVAGKASYYDMWSDILVFKGRKSDGWLDIATGGWMYDYWVLPWIFECGYNIKNNPHLPGYILTGDVDSTIMVMSLMPNLTVGWGGTLRVYNIPTSAHSRCIEPTADVNYVFTGWTSPGIPGPVDLLTTKIDLNGFLVWSKVLTGCSNCGSWMNLPDYGRYIVECKPDTYTVAGYTDWPPTPWDPTNLLVVKMDANGNIPCPPPDTCMHYIETMVDTPRVNKDSCGYMYPLDGDVAALADSAVYIRDSVICSSTGTGIGDESIYEDVLFGIRIVPNPFTTKTALYFNLTAESRVQVEIYDVAGRQVSKLIDERIGRGRYTLEWDGRDKEGGRLAQGVYFYRIKAGDCVRNGKMILIR